MVAVNPPSWMQAGSYPARNDRLALTALLSYPGFAVDEATPMRIRQGVKPSFINYQLAARPAGTPNMTVIIAPGFCYIDQHDTGGTGTYVCVNDGDVTLNIAPAGGAGQYRKDTVVASVYDQEYAGSASEWRLEVIQGPYAASAGATVRGSLPPNAQVIADLTIAPSQTAIDWGHILDIRQYSVAAGGIIPVGSANAPNRPHPGQMLYLTDTDVFEVGQSAGTKRQVREYVRPSQSLQSVAPPLNATGAYFDFLAGSWAPITVTVPPSGMVRVTVSADAQNTNTATSTCHVAWRASGAITIAASTFNQLTAAGGRLASSRTRLITGATPGQPLTITPQWNISSGSAATAAIAGGNLEVTPIP
ncbi:hypothetical protein [Streptomyces phaeochromogenes]|uniref:hypothetical protein n=1 Tax=Streptomyces phaeochromogenes TaxID=1923 RepID=UPI002DD9B1A4|nr:hypothetical protein [Streptomyces phaeochromogenes]WRZ32199.1 hypothetical protein OG931_32975 [Streptomyces phaeochromogenes]